MDAANNGRRALRPRRLTALACAVAALALAVPVAQAGEESTVGPDDECLYGHDDFRDIDGDGCAEPLVSAGDLRLQFTRDSRGRIDVVFLTLSAAHDAAIEPFCKPRCRGRVYSAGGRRVEVDFRGRRFGQGDLVGVRVYKEGHVGRYFGYRVGSKPRYLACLVRWYDGPPKRCHS